ncbi:MAG: cysteine hydrolase [Actinomycetota bacterium]|nr:cysteine hydrolase [Actinomycetota bacterium]
MSRQALIVVDVQQAFDDPRMGPRNNPACDENVAALIEGFRRRGEPVVVVRHDSVEEGSALRPGEPGNALKDYVAAVEPDLLVSKSVNSAFIGEPDLDAWLRERGIGRIAVCGIQTNHCCETTARMGANMGYEVDFVIDATHTFDRGGFDADTLSRVTAVNLDGEFATVVTTAAILGAR